VELSTNRLANGVATVAAHRSVTDFFETNAAIDTDATVVSFIKQGCADIVILVCSDSAAAVVKQIVVPVMFCGGGTSC